MAQNGVSFSYNDLTSHQDDFEIKYEVQEDPSTKIYRVTNYVQKKYGRNFSQSCRILSSCAAMCIITIITVIIINHRQNSHTKIIEISKDNLQQISSNGGVDKNHQTLKKSVVNKKGLHNDDTYNENDFTYSSNRAPQYSFLQEILISDSNKLWLFDVRNKSLSQFYEAESIIDTFSVFTKEQLLFSSVQEASSAIYAFSDYKSTSSIDTIFNETRFKSRGIAYDFISKNIYAVDEDMGTLIVIHLNTKLFTLLLTDLIQPRNVHVDPFEGVMFILQVSHSILKGDMYGENLHDIINRTGITTMTVDYINKRIYWVNDIIGIESSDYNGNRIEQFPTNTATIIDLSIADGKLFWIWQNHYYPTAHHLLYCEITGAQCENHEMHLLENLHNLTTIRTLYELTQNSSKLSSYPCEMENGGCEQMCFSIPNEKSSCACKLGWQLNPDKKTCHEVSNFLLYMSENVIRGHVLDVVGRMSTEIILPTPYNVDDFDDPVRFDYDQINDRIYFSDGRNIYRSKIREYKHQNQITLLSNNENKIIDITYDWLTGNLYSFEYNVYSGRIYYIKTFHLDELEITLKLTQSFLSGSRIYSGINIHPRKQLFFYNKVENSWTSEHNIFKSHYSQGSQLKMITTASSLELLKRPVSLDLQENKLYWIENHPEIVMKRANFDGSGVEEIPVDKLITATYVFVYQQWIYLANDETVWRIYKKTGKGAMKLLSKSGLFSDVRLITNHTV